MDTHGQRRGRGSRGGARGRAGEDGAARASAAPGVYAAVPGPASPELVRRGDEVLALEVLERPPGGGRRLPNLWMSLLPDTETARALERAREAASRVEARLRVDAQRARARAAWEAARASGG